MSGTSEAGDYASRRRPRAGVVVLVLALHVATALWLSQARPPAAPRAETARMTITLLRAVEPTATPAQDGATPRTPLSASADTRRAIQPSPPSPAAATVQTTPAMPAPEALRAAAGSRAADVAAAPASAASALDLALSKQWGASDRAARPWLSDTRSNTARPSASERFANGFAPAEETYREELLADGRLRVHTRFGCFDLVESATGRLDPMGNHPKVTRTCP